MHKFFSFFLLILIFQLINAQTAAVCAYEKGFVRQSPSLKAEVVAVISFGKENVYLTDEKVNIPEERNRTYVKVTTEDAESGWILEDILVREGRGAVVKTAALISPQANGNPKSGFSGEFEEGEVLIKMEQEGEFVKVYGFEKKKEGWVLAANLMEGEEEVGEGVWLARAMKEKTDCERAEKIQTILHNPAFEINQMTEIVERAFQKMDNLCKNPQQTVLKTSEKVDVNNRGMASQTFNEQPKPNKPATSTPSKGKVGTTPINSKPYDKGGTPSPKTSAASSRTMSAKGKMPATVKGTMANISQISKLEGQVGGAHKYSEKLQLVEVTTETNSNKLQCYHNTLPKGAKIMLQMPDNEGEIELEVVGGLKTKEGLGLTNPAIKRVFGEKIPRFISIYYLVK